MDVLKSPELPNMKEDPQLLDTIEGGMISGPCGLANPSCPCKKVGHCTNYYQVQATAHQLQKPQLSQADQSGTNTSRGMY